MLWQSKDNRIPVLLLYEDPTEKFTYEREFMVTNVKLGISTNNVKLVISTSNSYLTRLPTNGQSTIKFASREKNICLEISPRG